MINNWRRRRRYRREVLLHQSDLRDNFPDEISRQDGPIVLLAAYNESSRLPAFFNWYRKLGVRQFIAIDNGSTDASHEWLLGQQDVITIRTEASYAGARHGSIWYNVLLGRMQPGQWVLFADADECLAYEDMDATNLREFTQLLEDGGCHSVFTPLIDLYPAQNINTSQRAAPDDFLSIPNYFHDRSQYVIRILPAKRGRAHYPDLRGGPRMNGPDPEKSPLLSKWSLFRYEPGRYVANSHRLFPRSLMGHSPMTAMLHFKYSSNQLEHLHSVVDQRRHGDYHEDYERYLRQYRDGITLYEEGKSCRYNGPGDIKPMLDAIQHARRHARPSLHYQCLDTIGKTM